MLFLINLDTAVERRRHMVAQLDALGLRFERVGFDGRSRTASDIEAWYRGNFGSVTFDHDALSGAEVGCWLSHLQAWKRLQAEGSLCAATVIEDDLRLAPAFTRTVEALAARPVCDVAYLGTSSRNISSKRRVWAHGHWLHEPLGTVFNTWGYVISAEYVQRFFATPRLRLRRPIDHFLGGNARQARPRIAILQPPVITEEPALGLRSQIAPHTFRIDRSNFVESARRRALESRMGALYYALYRFF